MENQEAAVKKSIIDPKYAGMYREKDWVSNFIDANVGEKITKQKTVKDADGNDVVETIETGKVRVDLDKLFALCRANNIKHDHLVEQRDRPNAAGRLRMTLGNSLRAASKHRHGLYDTEGNWVDADPAFLGDAERTQERDGTKIAKVKPAAEPEAEE